jgi:hypothetical protein
MRRSEKTAMKRQVTIRLDVLKNDRHQITPEGYLVCDAAVTRAGVFDYLDAQGKLTRELRPPEEVFAPESLATLALQPITFHHPASERVDADNVRQVQVGVTGENVAHDDQFVNVRVKITDKSVVEYALERRRNDKSVELSCGYSADVVPMSGEHPKEGRYDAVQKNIRYNHVSIVPAGRAGENVKLKLDAQQKEKSMFKFIRKAMKLDGFTMDAIEADVPAEAQGILGRLSAKLDEAVDVIRDYAARIVELTKKNDEAQAKADTLSEENKKLKADVSSLSDPTGEKIQKIIADRRALETVAGKVSVKADGLSDQAVKVAVIQKQAPEFKADGKSDDYINARFDAVVELLDAAAKDGSSAVLAQVIRDARSAGTQGTVDHRSEFIKKSQELANK